MILTIYNIIHNFQDNVAIFLAYIVGLMVIPDKVWSFLMEESPLAILVLVTIFVTITVIMKLSLKFLDFFMEKHTQIRDNAEKDYEELSDAKTHIIKELRDEIDRLNYQVIQLRRQIQGDNVDQ